MKTRKWIFVVLINLIIMPFGCTDLDEDVYSVLMESNFFATKADVIAVYQQPFSQSFGTLPLYWYNYQEDAADFYATYHRQAHWLDNQTYYRLHYHTWTIDDTNVTDLWNWLFRPVGKINNALDQFEKVDYISMGITEAEMTYINADLRTLRCWLYLRAFAVFRNIPLVLTSVNGDQSKNSVGQVAPQVMFEWLEKELIELIDILPAKSGASGNGTNQERWNKAGAASMLVRLYLNAEKWIGVKKYTECAAYAEKIINGDYGFYEVDARWDRPFDYDNHLSNEIIYGFNTEYGQTNGQYSNNMFWWSLPFLSPPYFGFSKQGNSNPRFGLQPGRDLDGNEYTFELGKPVVKFQRYPSDVRLKLYKNTSNKTREGLFLFGYLITAKGDTIKWDNKSTLLYIRDQAGWFENTPPTEISPRNKGTGYDISDFAHADQNSGWYAVKYPMYPDDGPHFQADYAEIRLPEIIYSLAECKFRTGDVNGAGTLLNSVRKRYYPVVDHAAYLYAPEGAAVLTEAELLDEWGREFLGEARRTTDLVRWNKFSQGEWWDKKPEADNHTDIYPISRFMLQADPALRQNPGYEDVQR